MLHRMNTALLVHSRVARDGVTASAPRHRSVYIHGGVGFHPPRCPLDGDPKGTGPRDGLRDDPRGPRAGGRRRRAQTERKPTARPALPSAAFLLAGSSFCPVLWAPGGLESKCVLSSSQTFAIFRNSNLDLIRPPGGSRGSWGPWMTVD